MTWIILDNELCDTMKWRKMDKYYDLKHPTLVSNKCSNISTNLSYSPILTVYIFPLSLSSFNYLSLFFLQIHYSYLYSIFFHYSLFLSSYHQFSSPLSSPSPSIFMHNINEWLYTLLVQRVSVSLHRNNTRLHDKSPKFRIMSWKYYHHTHIHTHTHTVKGFNKYYA